MLIRKDIQLENYLKEKKMNKNNFKPSSIKLEYFNDCPGSIYASEVFNKLNQSYKNISFSFIDVPGHISSFCETIVLLIDYSQSTPKEYGKFILDLQKNFNPDEFDEVKELKLEENQSVFRLWWD